MKKYERIVNLRTVYLTIIRRYKVLIAVFLTIVAFSFVVTRFLLTKTYQSKISVSKTTYVTETYYNVFKSFAINDDTLQKVSDNLVSNGVFHSNGDKITVKEIYSGIGFDSFDGGSSFIIFWFQTSDLSIAKPVLNEIAATTVSVLKTNPATSATYANLIIVGSASEPKKNSKEDNYFLMSVVLAFAIAFISAFSYELLLDEVYGKEDVEMIGCDSCDLSTSKKGKR